MKGSKLTKEEQETIIIYNNADSDAIISTYDKKLIDAINARKDVLSSEITELKNGEGFAEYTCPKKWVKVKFPHKLSSERQEELRNRMLSINSHRKDDVK